MDELNQLTNRVNLMERNIEIIQRDAAKDESNLDKLTVEMYRRTDALQKTSDRMHSYMKGFAACLILIPALGTSYNAQMLNEFREIINQLAASANVTAQISYPLPPDDFLPGGSQAKKPQLLSFAGGSPAPHPCPVPERKVLFITDMRRFFEGFIESEERAT